MNPEFSIDTLIARSTVFHIARWAAVFQLVGFGAYAIVVGCGSRGHAPAKRWSGKRGDWEG